MTIEPGNQQPRRRSSDSPDPTKNELPSRALLRKRAKECLFMIRLILIGAAGYLLATRPELRERVIGTARDMLGRLSAR